MRTKRVSSGIVYTYTYEGSTLFKMTADTNALIFAYGANGHPMTVEYNSTSYYYVTNALGDVLAIVNASGAEVVTCVYDAWGNVLSTGGTMASTLGKYNPFRYRSYVYDHETGLYYLQSRYYNPAICRFISADSIGYLGADGTITSYNLFAYCGNNPVNYYDPNGRFVITIGTILTATLIGLAVGTTAGGIAGAAVAACNDTDILTGFVSGAIGGAILGAGAGVGALFLAPLIVGETVALSAAGGITALSAGGAIAIGLTIGGVTGIVGGGLADLSNQLGNNGMNWGKVDVGSIAISAFEYGVLNMVSTGLGSLIGPYLSNGVNLLGSKLLNVIPTGWGFAIDALRGRLQ